MRSRGPFAANHDGSVEARLTIIETQALANMAREMIQTIGGPDAPERLFPPASLEPELAAEFAALTHDDQARQKIEVQELLLGTLERGLAKRETWRATLSAEDAHGWLLAINDARLVLGTQIDVTDDMDHGPLPASDPRAPAHNMYVYLSALEGALVDALYASLPPGGTD